MNEQRINPEKITKPIQLLAAWLIGLILLVGALITGATQVTEPDWLPIFFSFSAVAIIPLFLYLIFKLQTKYRPQMQEDHYYSEYLNKNTMTIESKTTDKLTQSLTNTINDRVKELAVIQEKQMLELHEKIVTLLPEKSKERSEPFPALKEFLDITNTDVQVNQKLDFLDEIEDLLSQYNVERIGMFGDEPFHKKPELFVLSFGINVNFQLLKELISNLTKYGLTNIRIVEEDFKSNMLYIGSYAFGKIEDKYFETLKLSDDILLNIQKLNSTKEIYSYVKRNVK